MAVGVSKRPLEGYFLAVAAWLFAGVAIFVAARGWLPPLASEHGAGIDRMLNYTLVTTGAFFVVGHIVLGYFLWRFGGRDRVSHRLASARTERRWTLVVVIAMALVGEGGVMVLGLPVWGKLYAAAPPPEAIIVEITGEQFAWNVRYPARTANSVGLIPNSFLTRIRWALIRAIRLRRTTSLAWAESWYP